MKKHNFFYALVLLAGLSSCTIFSVHPLYDQNSEVRDNRILGQWIDRDDPTSFARVDDGKTYYKLTRWEKEDTIWYEAHLLKIGDYFYMDLYPLDKNPYSIDDQLINNFFPAHSFFKIEIDNEKVVAILFDEDKMMNLFKQNRIRLQHEMLHDYVLITAGTKDLQKFIQKYSSDHEVFSDPTTFIKFK